MSDPSLEREVTMKVTLSFSSSLKLLHRVGRERLEELRTIRRENPNIISFIQELALENALTEVANSMADAIESSLIESGDSSVTLNKEFQKVFDKMRDEK